VTGAAAGAARTIDRVRGEPVPRLAVLHHPNSFFPLDLRAEVGDAAELVWVVDSTMVPEETLLLLRRIGEVVDTAGARLEATAEALADLGVEGVVSFVDDYIENAAELAALLGLRYHTPEVARTLVNKQRQRAVLAAAGIPGPAFWTAPGDLDEPAAAELAARVAYPAVVKPALGSGSRDICLVRTPSELRAVLADGPDHGLVIEEYLVDEADHEPWYASYLSVESVVSEGRIGHVALTGRFPLAEPFRESGNFIPALCPAGQVPELLSLVDDTLQALRITDSLTHTEIKLTPDGPRVIEVNGRLGGRPPFVLTSVSDTNLFRIACAVALGVPVHIEGLARCDGVGFWLMLHAPMEARRLDAVVGSDDVAAFDAVSEVRINRCPGESLDWREGTDGKIVTIRGTVGDHDELRETVARIRASVTITTDGPGRHGLFDQDGPGAADLTASKVLELPSAH
jgi:biotin carboxylase